MKRFAFEEYFYLYHNNCNYICICLQEEHSKHYDTWEDDLYHMRVFLKHKQHIDEHNQQYEDGLVAFKLGHNKYSDIPHHVFVSRMNGVRKPYIDHK